MCRLDSRSRVGFWKNDKAAVRAIRTIQYNNLLFYLLLIIIIYYLSDSPSSLMTESLSVLSPNHCHLYHQHRPPIQCHLRIRLRALLMQHFLKDLTIVLSGMALHAANTHRATSEGAARLIFPVSVNLAYMIVF